MKAKLLFVILSITWSTYAAAKDSEKSDELFFTINLGKQNEIIGEYHRVIQPELEHLTPSKVARRSSQYQINYSRANFDDEKVELAMEIFKFYLSYGDLQLVKTNKKGLVEYYLVSENQIIKSRRFLYKENAAQLYVKFKEKLKN